MNPVKVDMLARVCLGTALLWLSGCQNPEPDRSLETSLSQQHPLTQHAAWHQLQAHGVHSIQFGQEIMLIAPVTRYFYPQGSQLSPGGINVLTDVLAFLHAHPVHSLTVTSDVGQAAPIRRTRNLALQRARAVARWLEQRLAIPLVLVEQRHDWSHRAMWGGPLSSKIPQVVLVINALPREHHA